MKSNRGRYKASAESDSYLQRTRNTAKFMRQGKLTFGKWKGSALGEVVKKDAGYVAWAVQNIDGFEQCLTPKMLQTLSKASKGHSGTKCHKKHSKPATRPLEAKNEPFRLRVQPPPEEERYFTPKELYLDDSLDIDAANDPDLAPW